MPKDIAVVPANRDMAMGGANDGAARLSRELGMYASPIRSADAELLPDKKRIDARARDSVRHDGYGMGVVATHRDSIVGSQFILNAQPDYKLLGLDETWAEEFQEVVESRFRLYAESSDCWLDASRKSTLTGLTRLVVGTYVYAGEYLATAEWLRDTGRPYHTAIQLVDPDRLSNPDGQPDTHRIRGGIESDKNGQSIAAHIRMSHESDYFDRDNYRWKRVPFRKPWGRRQVLHGFEPLRISQTRGVAEMVAVLKQMRMTSKYQDIVLQNAVVNATYAATIESELPRDIAMEQLGGVDKSALTEWGAMFLGAVSEYTQGAKNIHIDGVKIPHLFPGTKLNLQPAGQAGGVGTSFEESLLRHIASALGLSYEQFSRDYTKTNYSSARASMLETWKYMQSRKKMIADAFATQVYMLWFEEALNRGDLPLPANAPNFYEGQNKDAYCACEWIGASRGQIDELKETQAAVMRINSGLSTYEAENAKLGNDWRRTFRQRSREQKLLKDLKLDTVIGGDAMKPGGNAAKETMRGQNDRRTSTDEQDDSDE